MFDEAVRVRADEVERRGRSSPCSSSAVVHRRPPAARHARVADLGAAEHPHAQVHAPLGDQAAAARRSARPRRPAGAPSRRAAPPSACGALVRARAGAPAASRRRAGARGSCSTRSGRRPASGSGRRRRTRSPSSTASVPSPLSCQRRRRAGASTSSHSSITMPLRAKTSASWPMITSSAPAAIAVGQAPDRVDERAEVGLVAVGQRVQARAHRPVRGLEHAQARLAAGAQQRVVGALVELDLVAEAPGGGLVGGAAEGEPGDDHDYSFTYGRPIDGRRSGAADDAGHHDQRRARRAAPGTARPCDSEKAGSRCASARREAEQAARRRARRPVASCRR